GLFLLLLLSFPGAPISRLSLYLSGYLPPISIWGRLTTGRWIIPGYDKVFVAPLLAVGLAAWMSTEILNRNLDPRVYVPMVTFVFLAIFLGMGPSLKAWRLTGNHRIVEGKQVGAVRVG